MERTVGDATGEELEQIAAHSAKVREERFPHITWEHTHVVRTPAGLRAFCLYESPDAQSVRDHAEAVGLPAEQLYEVETDLMPPTA